MQSFGKSQLGGFRRISLLLISCKTTIPKSLDGQNWWSWSALIIQIAGASSAAGNTKPNQTVLNGRPKDLFCKINWQYISYPYLHGWRSFPGVLHPCVRRFYCQVPSKNSATHSTRRGGSIKCVAVTVCSLCCFVTHNGKYMEWSSFYVRY
jgi:hypothetical protein